MPTTLVSFGYTLLYRCVRIIVILKIRCTPGPISSWLLFSPWPSCRFGADFHRSLQGRKMEWGLQLSYHIVLFLTLPSFSFILTVKLVTLVLVLLGVSALHSRSSLSLLVSEIQEYLCRLHTRKKVLKFCSVPSHVNISRNELADKVAFQAANVWTPNYFYLLKEL